jgi:hypothetical protein
VVAAEVVRPIATHAAGEMAVAEGGGSTRTAGLLTILAAEAAACQAVESIEGVATTSASRGIDTAAVAAEVEDVGISQIMITKLVMSNFLWGLFRGQQLKMMFDLYLRNMGMFLKLL